MVKKHNIFLLLAVILFSLVILTSMVSSGILAKYLKSDDSNDDARVAEFNIDVTVKDNQTTVISETIEYQFVPGSSVSLNINVDAQDSEVATKCTIMFETLNCLPLTITHNGSDVKTSGITSQLAVSSSLSFNDIMISWDKSLNSYLFSGQVDIITVTIIVEQVD